MLGLRLQAPRRPRAAPARRRAAARAASADSPTEYQAPAGEQAGSVQADDDFVVVGDDETATAAPAYEPEAPEASPALVDGDGFNDAFQTDVPLPTYLLNCLYLDKAIGIAVDQRLASGEKGPVTEYYWWPANDAWGDLKAQLEGMPWIPEADVVDLMNQATHMINFWQGEEGRPSLEDARAEFPDCTFYGS